ncbi:MAG TPA: hypothetical protein VFO18_18380 [Methylomirabilota bacterium]|nr:hypothetical protein [Methylomirabilota bacterium]
MLKRILATVLLSLLLAWVCDVLWLQVRIRYPGSRDAFGTRTFYYATPLKSGRLEIFWNQPQSEVCVRSLFPHGGRVPCWSRPQNSVKTID